MTTTIIQADARHLPLADKSVNCCVTSPPYFGLRDYGNVAQIGLEPTPAAYVDEMVKVFREVRRVLRDDGTCWINLGDSYAAQRGGTHMTAQTISGGVAGKGNESAYRGTGGEARGAAHRNAGAIGVKHKDLIGIPWMVAFALRADGWYLRQDIIWAKPNPMPESVTDRCTKAHEYIFLLSKSAKYYYDAQAIQEDATSKAGGRSFGKQHGIAAARGARAQSRKYDRPIYTKRNRRSVWTVATKSYKGAHFATFPPKLIEPCILAGCPFGGTVLDPFAGSGTTLRVAADHGRNAIGIELNPDYIALAHKRLAEVATKKPTRTRRRMAEVQLRLLG